MSGVLGVVQAGGQSRRMGHDKAALLRDGEPFWRRQARILRGAGAARVLVGRQPGQSALPGAETLFDRLPGAGPLSGLHAALSDGLARCPACRWVALLAVDMPALDASWFRWLRGFCRPGAGALVRHGQAFEPLAALYPAEALAPVTRLLLRGDHSLQDLALELAATRRMVVLPIPAARLPFLRNLNRPQDLLASPAPPPTGRPETNPYFEYAP